MTYSAMVQSYQSDMVEFKNEDHCKCVKLCALYDKLTELEDELHIRYMDYDKSAKADRPYFERALIASPIPKLLKDIQKVKMSIRIAVSEDINEDKITPDMIIEARNYPIENILKVNRQLFALCINHTDKKPSLYTKGNFGYCFVCGYSGDCIDIYSKLYNVDFRNSVLALCGK